MKKIVLSILTGFIVFASCNDDDLLVKNPHGPTDKSFYITVAGATQGLMAAYDVMQLGEKVERIELTGTVCSGDAMAGGQPGGGDQPSMQDIMKFHANSGSIYSRDYWGNIYMGIYRCNLLMQYLNDKTQLQDFPADDVLRQQLIGEAFFLRGLFHFKLQIMFGGYPQLEAKYPGNTYAGVPFIDKVLPSTEWVQIRPSVTETWSKIEQDFHRADSLLKNRDDYPSSYRGRATKGAAKAMLAKTYLYQNKFSDAYPIFDALIASGQYKLMGEEGEKFTVLRSTVDGDIEVQMPAYKWIWQPEANNCDESIFDVQHVNDHSTSWPEGYEGSMVATYCRPRNVFAYNDAGLLITQNIGWGFILPTTYFLTTAYKNIGCEPNSLDPRYRLSVIEPTDSLPFAYTSAGTKDKHYPDSVMYDAWFNWPCTGYSTWKYFEDPIFNRLNTQLGDNPLNTKYFRYADLLLMGAEAALQTGHPDKATEWINHVRKRARNSGNTGFPKDLSQAEVTLEAVYAERRVELAFEGHQFFDLVRTGRVEQILTQDAMAYPLITNPTNSLVAPQQFGDQFQAGKNEILPVPQGEVDLSGGKLIQNPGY
jgi:starch-binding outer membrane protein, SusD/RagB family